MTGKRAMVQSVNTRRIGYTIAISVNIIMFYLFNNLLNWNVPFLTNSFIACLWILNISIIATIIANFFFIFYDEEWFKHLSKATLNLIGLAFIISLYFIFPFSLESPLHEIAKILLTFGVLGSIVSIFVEIIKFIKCLDRYEEEKTS